jgi:hypothetical protein
LVEKDYLLRQIEKMGVILAGIRELVFGGEPVRAMVELRREAARAGVAFELLDALAAESLLEILGESNLEKLIPAAQVLLLKAELEAQLGETEASAISIEKAALIARRVRALVGEGGDPELQATVEGLFQQLEDRVGRSESSDRGDASQSI